MFSEISPLIHKTSTGFFGWEIKHFQAKKKKKKLPTIGTVTTMTWMNENLHWHANAFSAHMDKGVIELLCV